MASGFGLKRLGGYCEEYTRTYKDCVRNYYKQFEDHTLVLYNFRNEKCDCDICKKTQLPVYCLLNFALEGDEILHEDEISDIDVEALMAKTRWWVKKRLESLTSFLYDDEERHNDYLIQSTQVPTYLFTGDDPEASFTKQLENERKLATDELTLPYILKRHPEHTIKFEK